ncbi:unnamed protein product [Fusarium graminearum]|nr:unnamed protein product [Fusarium graminearum]VTO83957.1 unnamed protein product [Fusarium graminearum]
MPSCLSVWTLYLCATLSFLCPYSSHEKQPYQQHCPGILHGFPLNKTNSYGLDMDLATTMGTHFDISPADLVPGLNIDGIQNRLRYAQNINAEITSVRPDFQLRTEHMVAIFVVDLKDLESGGGLSPDACDPLHLKERLESISPFCKHYMLHRDPKNLGESEWAHAIPGTPEEQPPLNHEMIRNHDSEQIKKSITYHSRFKTIETPPSIPPSKQEQMKCVERDGHRCVVTGSADPRVFWFIPETWNDTVKHNDDTGNLEEGCINLTNIPLLEDIHSAIELGKTHKAWNMLSVCEDLYEALTEGRCAFKYMGRQTLDDGKVAVELQFYWMPFMSGRFNRPVGFNPEDPSEEVTSDYVSELPLFEELFIEMLLESNAAPGLNKLKNITTKFEERLRSGYSFHVTMPKEDAEKFKSVVKVHWACMVFTALCGGTCEAWYMTGRNQTDGSLKPRDREFNLDKTGLSTLAPRDSQTI